MEQCLYEEPWVRALSRRRTSRAKTLFLTTDFIFGSNFNEVKNSRLKSHLWNFVSGNGFAREGYPVRSLFSIPYEGLTREGLPTFRFKGDRITPSSYNKINFQEIDNLAFLKYEGSAAEPTFNGSQNIFTFKNLKLNIFIT